MGGGGGDGSGRYATLHAATALKTDAGDDNDGTTVGDHVAALPVAAASVVVGSMDIDHDGPFAGGGTVQEPAYRDRWFAVAFLAHLAAVGAVAVMYATGVLETTTADAADADADGDDESGSPTRQDDDSAAGEFTTVDEVRFLSAIVVSLAVAPTLSFVAMGYMKTNAQQMIRFSLYFAIGLNLLLAVVAVALAGGDPVAAIWNVVFALILACYARAVWHRIPFAAANLKTAITCVRSNGGMALLGWASIPLFAGWAVLWAYVATGALSSPWMQAQEYEGRATDDFNGRTTTHEADRITGAGQAAIFALLLSFHWTWHVLRNIVHTTLAGTVGTWWVTPREATGCCSAGLRDSLFRSVTYSFGSICLGSLLVAIVEAIRGTLRVMARSRRAGILRCVAQCLLLWVERIAEYFNRWAFVYVGLYGYSYIDAGKRVFALFAHRGWTVLISDTLVNRMLGVMCLCVGMVTSLVAVAVATIGVVASDDGAEGTVAVIALFAFFIGALMSSMVFGVLSSAVEAVVVLFAEAPAELWANHPELAEELHDTWAQAWPDLFTPAQSSMQGTAVPVAVPVAGVV